MVVVRFCGGLGNQMFQYAAGRRLALNLQTDLILDLGWYSRTPSGDTKRFFELGRYPIQARATNFFESVQCRLYKDRFLSHIPYLPRKWVYQPEKYFDFDKSILSLSDNVYLDGYWQSHLYFEEITNIISKELQPFIPCGAEDQKITGVISECNSVSIHVRRGDYITNSSAAVTHGLCSIEYYKSAIAKILDVVDRPNFFIFSDDLEWTKKNLSIPGPTFYIGHNNAVNAFQDLRLMSQCNHHIIANSSFSWWGAWLNHKIGKVVIAPKRWFIDNRNTKSLMPSSWIRL